MAATKYAAISLLAAPTEHLHIRMGAPTKHVANPLFSQDLPWESPPGRIDNGYPNVVPPADVRHGGHTYFQLWYGTLAYDGTRHRQLLCYAVSKDGIHWEKPELGIFDLDSAGIPPLAGFGKANNIIVEGGGIGVYRDPHDPDPARRYKAIGPGCWLSPTLALNGGHCGDIGAIAPPSDVKDDMAPQTHRFVGQIVSSADGLTWPHVLNVSWPPPQKWDTHSNVFFDERSQRYVATTRNIPVESTGVERETSLTRSMGDQYAFDTSEAPHVIVRGSQAHQIYAQITWPWLNIYLGLDMVFDTETPTGKVHCRLMHAPVPEGPWRAVEGKDILDAPDFLPLGAPSDFDSHIIFAAAMPFRHGDSEWLYYMGGDGPHSGARNSSFALATLRPDGFASVRGRGIFRTPSLVVTGAMLTATVDFSMGGGRSALRVGVLPDGSSEPPFALSLNNSVPLIDNATDAQMHFEGGCGGPDLTPLLGKRVQLEVSLEGDALLYSLGFAPREDAAEC